MNRYIKTHFVDIGYENDTVIYELVPKEVARLKLATPEDIKQALMKVTPTQVLVNSAYPREARQLRRTFAIVGTVWADIKKKEKEEIKD